MKNRAVGIAALVGILSATSAIDRQEPYTALPFEQKIAAMPVDTTLNNYIDAATMLTILAEFDLEHMNMPPIPISDSMTVNMMGLTDFERSHISINDQYKINLRKFTILHELEHIIRRHQGYQDTENQIDSLAEISYRNIYGIK